MTPIHSDTMLRARKIALSSGLDWPRKLGAAQTLSQSADPNDTALARHIRTAYSLDLQGLLNPVDPTHRDKSDRVDEWREAIKLTDQPETSRDVFWGMQDRFGDIVFWGALIAVALLAGTGFL